jgi:uncharacterized protein (TIGR02598 family)
MTKKLRRGDRDSVLDAITESKAFSLIEVVIAIGVFSFCLLTLAALIPVGLTDNKSSHDRMVAADLCSSIESDLRATPIGSTTSPLYSIALPTGTTTTTTTLFDSYSAGTTTFKTGATAPANSQFRFTITLTPAATTAPNDPILANIMATWPAPASTANAIGKVNICVAINRVGS